MFSVPKRIFLDTIPNFSKSSQNHGQRKTETETETATEREEKRIKKGSG